jgi:hypothetical protein
LGDWNLFFATAAGSSATLVGLLFVATQLHIEVFKDPTNRWAALAQSTLTILSVIFILALFFVMPLPSPSLRIRGDFVVIVVVFSLWRTIGSWWPVVGMTGKGRGHQIIQSVWLLVVPLVWYAYLVRGGVQLIQEQPDGALTVATALLALFAIALRNAWRLVVAVAQEPAG